MNTISPEDRAAYDDANPEERAALEAFWAIDWAAAAPRGDSVQVLTGMFPAAKVHNADGSISPAARSKQFLPEVRHVGNLDEYAALIDEIGGNQYKLIIRGTVDVQAAAAQSPGLVYRRVAFTTDTPHHRITLDVDGCDVGIDPVGNLADAVARFRARLPEPFRAATCHVKLSGSARPGGNILRGHVTFWMRTPLTGMQCDAYIRTAGIDPELKIDLSAFRKIQPLFTANPVLAEGVPDPLAGHPRAMIVRGACDTVTLDWNPPQHIEDTGSAVERDADDALPHDELLAFLNERGHVIGPVDSAGRVSLRCPFASEHDGDGGPTSTVALLAGTGGFKSTGIRCMHTSCQHRKTEDFKAAYGFDAWHMAQTFRDQPPAVLPTGSVVPAGATVVQPAAPVHRRRICITASNLAEVVDNCQEVLRTIGTYQRAGELVRLIRHPGDRSYIIDAHTPESLLIDLSRGAEFYRPGKPTPQVQQPPDVDTNLTLHYAKMLTRARIYRPSVPILNGIAHVPTLRADGSVLASPGYDERSGVFLDINGQWPPVPVVTPDNALAVAVAALRDLFAPFAEFGFDDEPGKSTFLAAILTTLVRELIPTAPVYMIDAPDSGSGKTALADAISIIGAGSKTAPISFPLGDEAEIVKTLVTKAIQGARVLFFDNVDAESDIDSNAVCAYTTSVKWSGRILGVNREVSTLTTVTVIFTGNQIRPVADMIRRTLIIRIVPGIENPGEQNRTFAFGPIGEYLDREENAKRLTMCGLLALHAFIVAGMPQPLGTAPMPSFEHWSRVIRSCLLWAGWADPVATQQRNSGTDPKRQRNANLLAILMRLYPPGVEFKASQVLMAWSLNHDLQQVILPSRGGLAPSPDTVGRFISGLADKTIDGHKLRRVRVEHHTAIYRIEVA